MDSEVADAVNFANFVNKSSITRPKYLVRSAWLEHAPFAFWITDVLRPRSIVELGTHRGFSYFSFCQAVSELGLETSCIAIDTWRGDEHAGFYDDEIYNSVKLYNEQHYHIFSKLNRSTFDEALSAIDDESVDLLHIDGRHFYDDVRHDFESYRRKLSDRAVVLFHDTQVKDRGFGVFRLWNELAQKHKTFEFLHGKGLGILGYGPNRPNVISELFQIREPEQLDAVRNIYARLGEAVRDEYQVKKLSADLETLHANRSTLRAKYSEAVQDLKNTRADLRNANSRMAALLGSSSWRLTAPLRWAVLSSERLWSASARFPKVTSIKRMSAEGAKAKAAGMYRTLVPEAVRVRVPLSLRKSIGSRLQPNTGAAPDSLSQAIEAGEAAMQRGDWLGAVGHWQAAIRLDGSTPPPTRFAMLSRAHRMRGKFDAARAALQSVPRVHANSPTILAAKAELASARGSWSEAVSRWQHVIKKEDEDNGASARAYMNLSRALRKVGDLDRSTEVSKAALEKYPDSKELQAELAKSEMAKGNWSQAIELWNGVLDKLSGPSAIYSRAKLDRSISERLADLASYQERISQYTERDQRQRPDRCRQKVVVYSAIVSNYDTLKLPSPIDECIDYVVYSDSPLRACTPFSVRPATYLDADPTRSARFVKTHPHFLLGDYDIAVWVDSNVSILGDLKPLIDAFVDSKKSVAMIKHPQRETLYEEAAACISARKDDTAAIEEQMDRYRAAGFVSEELVESNVMMINLRDERALQFLDGWWAEIDKGSKRDQLSCNYVLTTKDIDYHHLMEPPQTARTHPTFSVTKHDKGQSPANYLLDALSCPVVDPYVGCSYSEVRQERLSAQQDRTIDIVVCVHNALADVKACFASIAAAKSLRAPRLIVVDDGSNNETAEFLRSFTETKSWASLHRNETSVGYTRAANQGLSFSTGDLVVVLNSDTVVTDFWAEKLADAVFSTPGAGIVGPLSNAASYQSIPNHQMSGDQTAINALPPNMTAEDMNRLCESWTTDSILPRVPLVHGFCFGITRDTIDRIGTFDGERFPRGYGEENDYCFRAVNEGIGLVVATHTYVYHAKSKSFRTDERISLMKAGSSAFRERHGATRVKRATQSMDKNPLLSGFRDNAAALYPQCKPDVAPDADLGTVLQGGEYDFLDLGSSEGGSLNLAKSKLGGTRGIGIDRDAQKVRTAQAKGFEVIQADALDLHGHPNSVRFAVMSHFLEHLPGTHEARQCIEAASAVAREFVFIKQPWFDSDGDLFRLGLKLYWSDWRGHPNHMTTLELHECFSNLPDVERWAIYGREQILDSFDSAVHPLASPVDQHAWDAAIHPPKPALDFDFPVYKETLCLVQKVRADVDFDSLLRGFSGVKLLYDSCT